MPSGRRRGRTPSRLSHALLLALTLSLLISALSPMPLVGDAEAQGTRAVKEKTFFLHTTNETKNVGSIATQHIMNTTVGTNEQEITSTMRIIARWLLYPELASSLTLNGTVNMTLWWNSSTGQSATWTLTISEVFADGTSEVVASAQVDNVVGTTLEEDSVNVSISRTFQRGSSIEAHINIVGDSATDYTIAWGSQARNSRVVFSTEDYIRIVPQGEGGILTLDSNRNEENNFDPDASNKTIYIQVKVTNPFGGYDISWVNLTVEDPNGTVIPELNNVSLQKVSGFFNSFESIYEVSWNYSGYPEGRYNITVYALDNNGYLSFLNNGDFGVHLEVETGVFFIGALPITVHILVPDGDGNPQEGVQVLVLLGESVETSGITNSTGGLVVDLAPGIYELQLWWKDTQVGNYSLDATEDIPFSDPFVATAAIYDLTFAAVDVMSAGLGGAALTVQFPNGTVTETPFVLNDAGEVSLTDMPGGSYRLTVTWKGEIVADDSFQIHASGTYVVAASVYYVTFSAVDADALPVENALVTVTNPQFGTILESQLTDLQGQLVSRLPPGSYEVNAKWFGVTVLEGYQIDVSGNNNFTLNLSVLNVDLRPVDSRGIPLEDASVTVTSGTLSQSANTLDLGTVSLRLPLGYYRIQVTWQNVQVFDETRALDGSVQTVELPARVFYLTITVQGSDGRPLENAFVTVARSGETVAAAHTNSEGKAEFRLPWGTYQVKVAYSTTYYLTRFSSTQEFEASLSEEQAPVQVTIENFPPPVYTTNLFFILVAIGVLMAGLVYMIIKLKGVS
jgi:hypothetical protein